MAANSSCSRQERLEVLAPGATVPARIPGRWNSPPSPEFHRFLHPRVEVGRRMVELQDALAAKVEELRQTLDQIKTLRGIVPICANCKKIRDDQGYWNQVEAYVCEHTEAEFSHGICPECMKKLYPQFEQTP